MRDSSRFPCHHRVWLGPVLGWPWLVTEHCSQWSGYCSSDQGEGTADREAIGDNLGNWVRGSHGRVKAGPGVSVSQGLLPPGSLLRLRLTDLTSFAEAGPLSMCPCSWWTSQSSEQWTIQEKKVWVFVSHLLPALSVVGWVKGGTGSWQSQPRRNHWQTWVDSLPRPWVNTSNENYISSALNPLLFFSRRSGCSSVFDWLE